MNSVCCRLSSWSSEAGGSASWPGRGSRGQGGDGDEEQVISIRVPEPPAGDGSPVCACVCMCVLYMTAGCVCEHVCIPEHVHMDVL